MSIKKKVLIIGAGFLQTFVIKRAKELGYYTLAVDADPQAIGFAYADEYGVIDIVDQDACLDYAKQHHIDGVLTAATDYGVLTASYIAQEMGLSGLKYEVAQTIKNKYLVRKCLSDSSVDDTQQAYEVDAQTDIETLKDLLRYPVMVKPCDGSGSRGASRVDNAAHLKKACEASMRSSITHRAEIEPFIKGTEYGAESFVLDGDIQVLAIMKKWMTEPPYYAELGHAIPCGLELEIEQKVKRCVERAIRALNIDFGSVNMDLLITDNGNIHIVDVGARMGGNVIGSHIIPLGTGIDYMGNMIRASVRDSVDFCASVHPGAVVTRLLALSPGTIKQLPNFQAVVGDSVILEHHLHIGDEIREYHTNLDGCGYIIATAEDAIKAEMMAETAKQWIDKNIERG